MLESRGFHTKVAYSFSFNLVSLKAKFEGGPLDRGLKTRVGWFSISRCCISETVQDRA